MASCSGGELTLSARVQNVGSLGVPAGVSVSFYSGVSPGGTLLGSAKTTAALLPGAFEEVTFKTPDPPSPQPYHAVVDQGGGEQGAQDECDEANNTGAVTASCGKF